jgi:hypothetical protein
VYDYFVVVLCHLSQGGTVIYRYVHEWIIGAVHVHEFESVYEVPLRLRSKGIPFLGNVPTLKIGAKIYHRTRTHKKLHAV